MDPEPRIVEPDEGGDPACWAHLFEAAEDETPSAAPTGDDSAATTEP